MSPPSTEPATTAKSTADMDVDMTLEAPIHETGTPKAASPKGPTGSPITPLKIVDPATGQLAAGVPPMKDWAEEEMEVDLAGPDVIAPEDMEATTRELLDKGASDNEELGEAGKPDDAAKKDDAAKEGDVTEKDDTTKKDDAAKKDDAPKDDDDKGKGKSPAKKFYGKD